MATLLSNSVPMVTPGVNVQPGMAHDCTSDGCCAAAGRAAPSAQTAASAASDGRDSRNNISASLT
jgi:hypothetical protein